VILLTNTIYYRTEISAVFLDFIYLNEEELLISKKNEYNEKYKILELDNKLNIA